MKSKLSRILKDMRAQRESIYGRRFANQSNSIYVGEKSRGLGAEHVNPKETKETEPAP